LQHIYDNHTQMIRQWAQQYPSHQLLEINVDRDDPNVIFRELLLLVVSTAITPIATAVTCPWTYQPPNEDWKNFSLPFR
jgi:hypothetical protein